MPATAIAPAINGFGLELFRAFAAGGSGNLLLSPYSIESALTMVLAGASGRTRDEMRAVLRLPDDEALTWDGFATLAAALVKIHPDVVVNVANRVFVQRGFALRPE